MAKVTPPLPPLIEQHFYNREKEIYSCVNSNPLPRLKNPVYAPATVRGDNRNMHNRERERERERAERERERERVTVRETEREREDDRFRKRDEESE